MPVVNKELGFYALAGQPKSPRDLIEELNEAEALGLGTAFISERYNSKEACTLSGAAGAVTESILKKQADTGSCTVVIGRRKKSRKEEFLFGSVSSHIIKHARKCSVWVVE